MGKRAKPQWRRAKPQIRNPKRVQGIVPAEGLGVSPNCLSSSPFAKGGSRGIGLGEKGEVGTAYPTAFAGMTRRVRNPPLRGLPRGVERGEAPGYELLAISSRLIVSEWGTKGLMSPRPCAVVIARSEATKQSQGRVVSSLANAEIAAPSPHAARRMARIERGSPSPSSSPIEGEGLSPSPAGRLQGCDSSCPLEGGGTRARQAMPLRRRWFPGGFPSGEHKVRPYEFDHGACRGPNPLCVFPRPPFPKGDQGGLARGRKWR
jgi:hypothetical protein